MHKTALAMVAVAAVGLAGAALYGFVLREEPLARGDLVEALLQEPDEARLTEVYARFVPVDTSLDRQAPILLANGFRCSIRPAEVEGSTYLTCDRPLEGTGYCSGFQYFSYQTRAGEIIDVLGSAFETRRNRNIFGRCEENRRKFFELAAESGETDQAAAR